VNRSWMALGDFVLISTHEQENDYGLIVDAPLRVVSIGGFVPIDLVEGNIVSLNVSVSELSKVEPSNPTSPLVVHYNQISAVLLEEPMAEILYADTSDLL